MTTLNLVECRIPIFSQLEVEEALLRVGKGSWCILNHGSPSAIILGLSSSLEASVDLEKIKTKPIPLFRRYSGGGTVVVDEDTLFFTLILEKPFSCAALMQHVGELLSPAFLPHELVVLENDFVISGKKIGGNAQSFSKERSLHHTSFLWSWNEELMSYLREPSSQPEYRKQRPHGAFCGELAPLFSEKELFFEKIKKSLSEKFVFYKTSFPEEVLFLPHIRRLSVV